MFILGLFFCLAATAQKKDTTIVVTMPLESFKALLYAIDSNIDSKKASKDIADFLLKSASILPPKQDSVIIKPPKK